MNIPVNRVVIGDASSQKGEAPPLMTFAEDYILGCFWNGHLPINVQTFAEAAGLALTRAAKNPWKPNVPDCKWVRYRNGGIEIHHSKPIQPDADEETYIKDWELELEIAFLLQWFVRNEHPQAIDPESERYKNGWKIAKHILMPKEIFHLIGGRLYKPSEVLESDTYARLCRVFNHIPPKEVEHRFRKVLCW